MLSKGLGTPAIFQIWGDGDTKVEICQKLIGPRKTRKTENETIVDY